MNYISLFSDKKDNLLILDIGSKFIKATMNKKNWSDEWEIVSSIMLPTKGIHKGYIINIDLLTESIYNVIYQVEIDCNIKIEYVYLLVSFVEHEKNKIVKTENIYGTVTQKQFNNITSVECEKNIYNLGVISSKLFADNEQLMCPVGQSCNILHCATEFLTCKSIDIQHLLNIFNKLKLKVISISSNLVYIKEYLPDNTIAIDIGNYSTRVIGNYSNNTQILDIRLGASHLYRKLWEYQKEPCFMFDGKYEEHVNITCEFFVQLFKTIITSLQKQDRNNLLARCDIPIYLSGGLSLIHGIGYFLENYFDRSIYILKPSVDMLNLSDNSSFFINNYVLWKYLNQNNI